MWEWKKIIRWRVLKTFLPLLGEKPRKICGRGKKWVNYRNCKHFSIFYYHQVIWTYYRYYFVPINFHEKFLKQGEKFPCNMCNYVATQKSNLTTHLQRVHSNGTIFCKVSFHLYKCYINKPLDTFRSTQKKGGGDKSTIHLDWVWC